MKKAISMLLIAATLITCLLAFAGCGPEAQVKVIDISLSVERYAFGVNHADTVLKDQINAFLAEINSNGKFREICNNYFGDGTPLEVSSAAEDVNADQLVVATNAEFAPFEYKNPNGTFSGIDMEIAYYLAQKLGKQLVIKDVDFNSVLNMVNANQADVVMAGLTVNPGREALVTFTDTYYDASQVLIVKADDTTFDACVTKEDVVAILAQMGEDKKFGCQSGTTGEIYIKGDLDNPEGFGFAGLNVTPMGFDNGASAIQAMINGSVDYVILDNAPAKAISSRMNG